MKIKVIASGLLIGLSTLLSITQGLSAQTEVPGDSVPCFLCPPIEKHDALEKSLYLAGASVLFAGFDFFGYNLTRTNPTALVIYRVCQGLVQTTLSWLLYKKFGLPTAIGFNLIWWTFGDDFIYYGFAELVNHGGTWDSRGAMKKSVLNNQTTWAYWTPVGISRGLMRSETIAGSTLIAQSIIGAIAGFSVTIAF